MIGRVLDPFRRRAQRRRIAARIDELEPAARSWALHRLSRGDLRPSDLGLSEWPR
jgi:hypothetical protein